MKAASDLILAGRRILIAKPGLDGHDIGAKVIALALRDAGAEVIYTGLRKTPEIIARAAIDEDVHAVGLSILSGSHVELVRSTMACLNAMGGSDIVVLLGGTIPSEDHDEVISAGVSRIFTSEMPLDDVIVQVAEALSVSRSR